MREQDFNQMGGDIEQLGEQFSRLQKEKKYIEDLYNVSILLRGLYTFIIMCLVARIRAQPCRHKKIKIIS